MTPKPPPPPKPPAGPNTPPPPAGPKKAESSRRPMATIEEVSEYLGVPVYTLYSWRRLHKGPKSAKVGRHVRYRWADVESWLDAQMADAA